MHLNEYQHDAMSFRLESADEAYAFFGLAGEVGELYSLVAKAVRDGERQDHREMVKKELGDILWFVAAIAYDHGYQLQDIAQGNINKLSDRADRGMIQGSGDER